LGDKLRFVFSNFPVTTIRPHAYEVFPIISEFLSSWRIDYSLKIELVYAIDDLIKAILNSKVP
jgi:hypothetical protein